MNIKKTSLFIITLILSVVLAACGDNNNTENNVNENGNSDSNNDAGTALVEDTRIDAENPSASPALAVDRGDTVVVGLQEPGGIFTPYFNTSGYDGNVQSVMFPPLVEINEKGEPIPGLAEDWDISEDDLTYTYYLRDGLLFDDGSPLTTEDVAFTLTLLHDPSYPGSTDITEEKEVGGLDYKKGDAEDISGINIVDEIGRASCR